jgi:hypothetical protein
MFSMNNLRMLGKENNLLLSQISDSLSDLYAVGKNLCDGAVPKKLANTSPY